MKTDPGLYKCSKCGAEFMYPQTGAVLMTACPGRSCNNNWHWLKPYHHIGVTKGFQAVRAFIHEQEKRDALFTNPAETEVS